MYGELIQLSKIAQITALYVSSFYLLMKSNEMKEMTKIIRQAKILTMSFCPKLNAAIMKENSPRQVMANPVTRESLFQGLKG